MPSILSVFLPRKTSFHRAPSVSRPAGATARSVSSSHRTVLVESGGDWGGIKLPDIETAPSLLV